MYEIWYDYMDTNSIIVHIKTDEAGLKKKILPSLDPGFASRVGWSGFFYFGGG